MKMLRVKHPDGRLSRWTAHNRNGIIHWTVDRYSADGYYQAHLSHSGQSPWEDYARNIETLKDMAPKMGIIVTEL